MTLGELLTRLAGVMDMQRTGEALSDADLRQGVSAVSYDSRQVNAGAVFVALRGRRTDGLAFANQALARGAIAVVAEENPPPSMSAPWLTVPDARLALAVLSAAFFGDPSEQMLVVGVTGTNGKTTTAYLLQEIFNQAGILCGRIGTVGHQIGRDQERSAPRTTPEAPDLQQLFRDMVDAGCGACVMEVSSHALALRRVDRTRFAAAVFTNLTRDHLDFHGDMESYFAAKRRLFEMLPDESVAIINLDDPRGDLLAAGVARPVTYGIERAADVRPGAMAPSLAGLSFDVRTPRGSLHVESSLVGRPNAYNLLAAIAAAMALDVPFSAIERGVARLGHVPGRFEMVSRPHDDVSVVVDYAHTDDALRNLLDTARPLAAGRLITVFGCGGDRDRTKRPLMGAVAARLSDVVVVTSDNPRAEDPVRIIEEIQRGIPPAGSRSPREPGRSPDRAPVCLTIVDRRDAIERAIKDALPGDLVVIAGKGHERYQEIGDRVLPFDDAEVARTALARRRSGSRVG
ncbi:MAG: UDP-N-acetylmuramoyl-L-alanyl-D-glutamate--2,6-diaminopimelate ligase [Acidobacteria bacterium]|nr:UDP-N-acetylmuramoyl-L-alanyl-D-glutamate--2,6-diaminopimelate ligase [Acidobacteriota bacterium]